MKQPELDNAELQKTELKKTEPSKIKLTKFSLLKLVKEDIESVLERDPAARNRFEVLTTYPGVHAIIVHRLANRMWNAGWRYTARLVSFATRVWSNIDIHPGATIGRRFFIDHGAGVVIGETAEIGDDVTLYHGVTLGGTSWNKGKRHPTLHDGVMVGAGAKILGPIVIGKQARVGANSVVVKDVPDGQTVVGIPGKVVQVREVGVLNPYGIDLNHHLIPDPVGKAITCLMDRMSELEKQFSSSAPSSVGRDDDQCEACEAENLCETDESVSMPKKYA